MKPFILIIFIKIIMRSRIMTGAALVVTALVSCGGNAATAATGEGEVAPRIVNIVNFIRAVEPRDVTITDDVLFETTAAEARLMQEHGFRGTFLIQYDALIIPRYQELLRAEKSRGNDIGAWWELTEPHVEKAGIRWRGRYQWDWHANVGFTTGYSPRQREKFVDVYMEEFKAIFGDYPKSVGSWYIDAHTLGYMYDKYGIEAACICKDQIGTDGYTLWGGYWTGAYYPSRVNSYMPAQDRSAQIPVPVFRMLGSDPIYQYDQGLGGGAQGVVSLEPVYPDSGGDSAWIRYYFGSALRSPALGFTYTQAGQENSFTWKAIGTGLTEQFRQLDSLKNTEGLRIETLVQSARWFKDSYDVTPPTALTTLDDVRGEGRRSVWFDSRYYRANLLWDGGQVRFRDIHIFDQGIRSADMDTASDRNQFAFNTLPVVDGYRWSTAERKAGIYFMESIPGIGLHTIKCKDPHSFETGEGTISFQWDDNYGYRSFRLRMDEGSVTVEGYDPATGEPVNNWFLSLVTAREKADLLPFTVIVPTRVAAKFEDHEYHYAIGTGTVAINREDTPAAYHIYPDNGVITLKMDDMHYN